jgi:hypothetical protein
MSAFDLKWMPTQVVRLEVDVQSINFPAVNGKLHAVTPSGALNVQLPAPSANFHCVIKDMSGDLTANSITIVRNGTENIDGNAANFIMKSNNQSITLFSDGTDWYII